MMVETMYKGWQGTIAKGPSGSEETIGKVNDASININNGTEAFHAAGSRTPDTIMGGNLLVSGIIGKAFIDGLLLAQALGSTSKINFVGINNGSATHIYKDKSDTDSNTKLAPASWSGTELSSTNYDKVEADDANSHSTTTSVSGEFAAHLIKFDAPGTEADIDLMHFEFVGYGTGDTNGFEVFVYDFDGTAWVSLGTSDASSAMGSLTAILEDTGQYQEVTTGDIYFLVRSRASKGTANNVIVADYAELRVFNTTALALQQDFSLKLTLDATTDITITIANAKLNDWSMAFADDGGIVFENVSYIGKTVSQTQA